jgi:hypothetical protein
MYEADAAASGDRVAGEPFEAAIPRGPNVLLETSADRLETAKAVEREGR